MERCTGEDMSDADAFRLLDAIERERREGGGAGDPAEAMLTNELDPISRAGARTASSALAAHRAGILPGGVSGAAMVTWNAGTGCTVIGTYLRPDTNPVDLVQALEAAASEIRERIERGDLEPDGDGGEP